MNARSMLVATIGMMAVVGVVKQQMMVMNVAGATREEVTVKEKVTEAAAEVTEAVVVGKQTPRPMPYLYPVHKKIPKEGLLRDGVAAQVGRDPETCADHRRLPLPHAVGEETFTPKYVDGDALLKEFGVGGLDGGLFVKESTDFAGAGWVPKDGNIPCTAEAQEGIWKAMHPADCEEAMFLSTRLKENAHGLGSALSLVVHDLITAIAVGRVLVVESRRWFFAPPSCGGDGWGCYFTPPSHCVPPKGQKPATLTKLTKTHHKIIAKKTLDATGMSRNDLPALEAILPKQCVAEVVKWTADPSNVYLMGTFERGSDPLLTWWMAQTLRYLMRSPQPWFSHAVEANLNKMGFPWEGGMVFEQLRGEIAKFREYYNVFGCHDVGIDAYHKWTTRILQDGRRKTGVYISGNTPYNNYTKLRDIHAASHLSHTNIISTWQHPATTISTESQRWGASSIVISWTDLWAGVASSSWVCIIQSNWCRIINFLRLTAGRAPCPFIDLGLTMMIPEERVLHCVVKPEWPTKPFSSVLKKLLQE